MVSQTESRSHMRKLLFGGALALSLMSHPFEPVSAQESDAVKSQKVNIAGRQRMLTQRIAKASCFIASFYELDKHKDMLEKAVALFSESHDAMKNGSTDYNFPKETNEAILYEMMQLEPLWEKLKFGADVLLDSYEFPGLDVDIIAQTNVPTLVQANEIVKTMDLIYTKSATTDGSVRAINVAGRQRMLSQKAAKEFCFIAYGLDVEANRENLKKTIQAFDTALDDLRIGDIKKGIPSAATFEIGKQLMDIKRDWQEPRAIMIKASTGEDINETDFKVISDTNDLLLKNSNAVVTMMVQHYKGS
jgi:nitrate/nitrite-specific signal transduction histidine kinase